MVAFVRRPPTGKVRDLDATWVASGGTKELTSERGNGVILIISCPKRKHGECNSRVVSSMLRYLMQVNDDVFQYAQVLDAG